MRKIIIVDTTLRDGAQAPDVFFSAKEKFRIAAKLVQTGITEIEAGIPAMGEDECIAIKTIVDEFPWCRISSWCRAKSDDIAMAQRTGCDTVHISFPLSDIHLKAMHRDESWLIENMYTIVSESKELFNRITIGLQDATRAPLPRVISFIRACMSMGVKRFRIADTVGILTPIGTSKLIAEIKSAFQEIEIDFHAHNDLGMATANAVTALMSGAEAVSVTVNGIGERAGNAALEEVAMAIVRSVPDLAVTLNTRELSELCSMVGFFSQSPIAPDKPVIGSSVFTHESGIHCNAILADHNTYEPFDPALVGRPPSNFVAGSHSGTSGILAMLGDEGKRLSREDVKNVIPIIRQTSFQKRRSLFASEVKQIFTGGTL
jgi:homocitrate synthase NifV